MEILIDVSPATNAKKNISFSLPIVNPHNTHTIHDCDTSILNQAVDVDNVTSCEQSKQLSLTDKLKMSANHYNTLTYLQSVKRPVPSTTTSSQPPSPKSYH